MLPVFPVVTFSSHSSGRRTKGPPPFLTHNRLPLLPKKQLSQIHFRFFVFLICSLIVGFVGLKTPFFFRDLLGDHFARVESSGD